ncbi:MAG: alpha-L-rhamnosidase-related protein [Actinomycetota bacterium]
MSGAQWIWMNDAAQFVFFRKAFDVVETRSIRLRVSADSRYVLWCNGVELGRGPVRSEPAFFTFDEYDVALKRGRNAFCALVRHYGRPTLYWKPAQPSGRFLLETELIDGLNVASDETWRVARAPYLDTATGATEGPPDIECLEPAAMSDWLHSDFDDSHWDHASVLAPRDNEEAAFADLRPRPISHLSSESRYPVEQTQRGDQTIFDFGAIVSGHVVVSSKRDVTVTAGEDLASDHVVSDVREWRMTKIGPGSMTSFEPIGFRYLEVDAPIERIHVVERTFPREKRASFACGDKEVDTIWRAGARTLDLCSDDAFIDCPSRERRAWLGDSYLHSLISFVCNPDYSLVKWNLRMHAQGQRPDGLLPMVAAGDFSLSATTIPDYSLHWVRSLARALEYTGDLDLIAELIPVAMRILDHFERLRDENGLIADLGGWIFIDWAQTERGRNIAAIDALYALALDDAAECLEALDDSANATRLRTRADRTRASFSAYYDPARGLFVDALGGGARGRRISQQTNSLAILCGAVSPSSVNDILDAITDKNRLVRTRTPADGGTLNERVRSQWMPLENFDEEHDVVCSQPFFAHFLHQALALARRTDDLLGSIKRWSAMLQSGNGCFGEYWEAPPGMGSRAHAWSATPTFDITTHIAGIRPAEPGWSRVRIAPLIDGFSCAVPTPHGWIECSIDQAGSASITTPVPGELHIGSGALELAVGANVFRL